MRIYSFKRLKVLVEANKDCNNNIEFDRVRRDFDSFKKKSRLENVTKTDL